VEVQEVHCQEVLQVLRKSGTASSPVYYFKLAKPIIIVWIPSMGLCAWFLEDISILIFYLKGRYYQ
jgi:hypothetical protein